MALLRPPLLVLTLVVVLARGYPNPPTCYTKVLNMARDLQHQAAALKTDPETSRCMAHMPDLHIDVHNACVMPRMASYVSLVEGLRERRCPLPRAMRVLGGAVRQLYIIMAHKCHGDLVFTTDDCAALD